MCECLGVAWGAEEGLGQAELRGGREQTGSPVRKCMSERERDGSGCVREG